MTDRKKEIDMNDLLTMAVEAPSLLAYFRLRGYPAWPSVLTLSATG
jgi:hypothetical protein